MGSLSFNGKFVLMEGDEDILDGNTLDVSKMAVKLL
jgi:hypothetical protein